MIALDTNILVRFITKDNAEQFQKVVDLFYQLEDKHRQAFVSMLVILETIWGLSHFYKIDRIQIIQNLLPLFNTRFLVIENSTELKSILIQAQHNTFNLPDLMIACRYKIADTLPIFTFDKKASKCEYFQLLT